MTAEVIELRDRTVIAAWLKRAADLHVYALADLDDFFWPKTQWWALRDADGSTESLLNNAPQNQDLPNQQLPNQQMPNHASLDRTADERSNLPHAIQAVAMTLSGFDPPVFYALAPPNDVAMARLLTALTDRLPARSFVNLMMDGALHLPRYRLASAGVFQKMSISHTDAAGCAVAPEVRQLTITDLPALDALHASEARDANDIRFFANYMLERWPYAGIFIDGELVAAGGCHVLSDDYDVAAIGNVITHPRLRGRGLATRITQTLCAWLAPRIHTIGLNVKVDNAAAIRCYSRVGFYPVSRYEEGLLLR